MMRKRKKMRRIRNMMRMRMKMRRSKKMRRRKMRRRKRRKMRRRRGGKKVGAKKQCFGSVSFWSGSGSGNQLREIKDPEQHSNFFFFSFFNQKYNNQNYDFFVI